MPQKKTILVVDDEKAFVEVLKVRLEALGSNIIVCYDGNAALDKAREISPDLILLDIMMTGYNGYEVCKKLKDDKKYKHIPILILSAISHEDNKLWAKKCGADDFITKPYAFDDLIKRINKFLSR